MKTGPDMSLSLVFKMAPLQYKQTKEANNYFLLLLLQLSGIQGIKQRIYS